MTREHTPAPGSTWERQLVTNEQLVPDTRPLHDGNQPDQPRPNRATRRAIARNNRKANQ